MDTPVVDFHNHLGRWTRHGMVDDQDRFLRIMDASGIDRACMNSIFFGDHRRGNDIVAEFVARRPDRFIPFAFVTPHYPEEDIAELERCFDQLGDQVPQDIPALCAEAHRRSGLGPHFSVVQRPQGPGDEPRPV